jgi:hypothetical protein
MVLGNFSYAKFIFNIKLSDFFGGRKNFFVHRQYGMAPEDFCIPTGRS